MQIISLPLEDLNDEATTLHRCAQTPNAAEKFDVIQIGLRSESSCASQQVDQLG